ncbi:hypothetical protein EMPS_03193 [Entomortierella parvispora]|uniref:Uncharacterized protein n=1 Tax=Entomortierella parvispora TaxID=205924 RepID=A0A9P3H6T3_9FUNG|nr:hypothetical protein EMPS_03193 [Entomortierella parvispora]
MASESKQDNLAYMDAIDEKRDVESVVLEDEEENSFISEVAAMVSNTDDPTLPCLTFRFWVMGVLFTVLMSFVNQFFWFRTVPMGLTALVIQLISYPAGKIMARLLPSGILNPGPFNIKEHVLVGLTANCASQAAYAVDIVVIQKVYYKQNFGFLANFLLILTTQMLGYGMAGVLRRYLVYPATMVWPANLIQVALFNTLHQDEQLLPGQWSRYKFFLVASSAMFIYAWLPGWLFSGLTAFAWLCWIKPQSILMTQIGGPSGLGIGALSLDWNNLVSYLGSPLAVPWWAQVNIGVGVIFIAYIMTPISYYLDLWDGKQFPILDSGLYTVNGTEYDVDAVMTDFMLDEAKYAAYGPLRITTFFALTYGIGFAGLTSMVTHTWLYHRHKLVAQWRQSRDHSEDIHHRLMKAYPEVPDWWYGAMFVVMTVVAIVLCEVWDYRLPWWAVLLCVALSCFFVLPIGLIQALTNQQPGLNVITEYVIGYLLPGRPIANVTFKVLGYISMTQALSFVGDLKLGHYMKIPPRAMFWSQCLGTVIAGLVNLITANWLLNSQPGICTKASTDFSCPPVQTFYSASVIWGVISPQRMFGATSIYTAINYFFLIGFLLPLPFYFLKKRFPGTWVEQIHVPVMLASTGMMPPASPYQYVNWLVIGFAFQFLMRRYRNDWHIRFTYILSASFDTGVAFMGLAVFFIFQNRGVQKPNWWGNRKDLCPLDDTSYYPLAPTAQ